MTISLTFKSFLILLGLVLVNYNLILIEVSSTSLGVQTFKSRNNIDNIEKSHNSNSRNSVDQNEFVEVLYITDERDHSKIEEYDIMGKTDFINYKKQLSNSIISKKSINSNVLLLNSK